MRRRVVLYSVIGLLGLDVLVRCCTSMLEMYEPNEYREQILISRRQQLDLVIVGGSTAREGIVPAVLTGLPWQGHALQRVYNLGLPGATASEVWHAVRQGLASPPRLLIYGITASDLNDSRQEPHGPGWLMDWGDLAQWVHNRPEAAEWALRHFVQERLARIWQLFYYRKAIRLWAAHVLDGIYPGVRLEAIAQAHTNLHYAAALRRSDGYAPRPAFQTGRLDVVKAARVALPRLQFFEKFQIVGGHSSYLNRLLDWADAYHVSVVLVDMPVSRDLEEEIYPEAYARYRTFLAHLERNRRARVLRAARTVLGLEDRHFGDLVHLNAAGAERTSTWIRRALGGSDYSEVGFLKRDEAEARP